MSFTRDEKGLSFNAGYFLESEVGCVRKTREISADGAVDVNGEKYIFAGTPWPSDDGSAEGIVYEDVNVTSGNMPGSVVVAGRVYLDRTTVGSSAKTALEEAGFVFVDEAPAVERPY